MPDVPDDKFTVFPVGTFPVGAFPIGVFPVNPDDTFIPPQAHPPSLSYNLPVHIVLMTTNK